MKYRAVRNIRLCTKDCLCLYVCPTGASDTENGQIDFDKCLGCGLCVNACPSHALSLVPYEFPEQQTKEEDVKKTMLNLVSRKINERDLFAEETKETLDPNTKKFYKALSLSAQLMAEDIARESSFLIPQSKYTIALLNEILENSDFDKEKLNKLIDLLKQHKL